MQRLLNSILSAMIHARMDASGDRKCSAYTMIKNLTNNINEQLRLRGEETRLSPEEVGHLLTSLGLTNRDRTSAGVRLWLDSSAHRQIYLNWKTLGDEKLLGDYGPQVETCTLCEDAKPT